MTPEYNNTVWKARVKLPVGLYKYVFHLHLQNSSSKISYEKTYAEDQPYILNPYDAKGNNIENFLEVK